jgi:hypothetical protein
MVFIRSISAVQIMAVTGIPRGFCGNSMWHFIYGFEENQLFKILKCLTVKQCNSLSFVVC